MRTLVRIYFKQGHVHFSVDLAEDSVTQWQHLSESPRRMTEEADDMVETSACYIRDIIKISTG